MSREMFAREAAAAPFTLVLSGYVTDSDGAADCVVIENKRQKLKVYNDV